MDLVSWVKLSAYLGAGLSVGLGAIGSAVGKGYNTALTTDGMVRQPAMSNELLVTMLIGQAVAESTSIYSLLISLLLIFRDFSSPTFLQIPAFFSAGICVGLGALGPGIGASHAGGKACEAIARNPETSGLLLRIMLLGQAVTQSTGIYALAISLFLLFVV